VFDSGLGGLTVLREVVVARRMPLVYVPTTRSFPTAITAKGVVARVVRCSPPRRPDRGHDARSLVESRAIPPRAGDSHCATNDKVPFVGHRAAISGLREFEDRRVSGSGIKGTVKRRIHQKIIHDFAQGRRSDAVGSPELARSLRCAERQRGAR